MSTDAYLLLFSLLFSMVCVLPVMPATGHIPYPAVTSVFIAVLSGGIFLKKHRSVLLLSSLLCISLCLVIFSHNYSDLFIGTENRIVAVKGTLLTDSTFSRNGNTVMNLSLAEAEDTNGSHVTARGTVTAVYAANRTNNEDFFLCAGTEVELKGSFSEELFICSGLSVTGKPAILFFRSNLILALKKRLSGIRLGEPLLLGKYELNSSDSELKNLALSCGCMHVLALSGMHLNIVGGGLYRLLSTLTKRKKLSRLISLLPVSAFLFIAGPVPSLIRAFLMFALFFLPPAERLVVSFLFQLLFVSSSVFSAGSAYGYASVAALLLLKPFLSACLDNFFPGFLSSALSASLSVLLFNAPLQLILNGKWYPVAIIAGPAAGALIAIQMTEAVFGLLFPKPAGILSGKTAQLLTALFEKASEFPSAGIKGFLIFFLLCTVPVLLSVLANRIVRLRLRKKPDIPIIPMRTNAQEDSHVRRIHC